jgi:multidrug efflux system membrane fusion protein
VRRGQVLARIDPKPYLAQLHQAKGALARDNSLLENTLLNLRRYHSLRGQELIPQQQVDDQQASVGQYKGALEMDKAQIESARLQLKYARVTSPIDGVTGLRLVDAGNLLHTSDPTGIVVITQIDPIAVVFTLPQDDLPAIIARMKEGPLPVEARSRDGETLLATGKLLVVDNQINQATGTLRLKAMFKNPKSLLWPNQFVKARLQLSVRKHALVVPASAIQRGPKGPFCYVITKEQTAALRQVQLAQIVGELALIGQGLKAGEQVVVEGQNLIRPGSRVSLAKGRGGAS